MARAAMERTVRKDLLNLFEKSFERLLSDERAPHLDSLIHQIKPPHREVIAKTLPLILRRPVGLARALGLKAESPWRSRSFLNTASKIFEHLIASRSVPQVLKDGSALEEFPEIVLREMEEAWGPALNDAAYYLTLDPVLSLRVSQRVSRSTVAKILTDQCQVEFLESQESPIGIYSRSYAALARTEEFQRGWIEIQNVGSQQVSLSCLEGGKAPKTVVDACSGAGGKALAIADLMKGRGRVYAYDVSAKKLQALMRRATRANLNNIQSVALQDGQEEKTVSQFEGSADVVLVDAPCSGLGVLRKNPDTKWKLDAETLKRFPPLQFRLLSAFKPLTRPGGRLIYSLCTFSRAESFDVSGRFAEQNPDLKLVREELLAPNEERDGMFLAVFERKVSP